jgi:hypothetical protein
MVSAICSPDRIIHGALSGAAPRTAALWSAAALGLAASTDFSAALIVPPFLFYRHILQR